MIIVQFLFTVRFQSSTIFVSSRECWRVDSGQVGPPGRGAPLLHTQGGESGKKGAGGLQTPLVGGVVRDFQQRHLALRRLPHHLPPDDAVQVLLRVCMVQGVESDTQICVAKSS